MAQGLKLSGAVIFVRELPRSQDFYQQLLDLDIQMSSAEAVVLSGRSGDQIILRSRKRGSRVFGGIGVQYLAWTAPSTDELSRCQGVLKSFGALVSSTIDGGTKVVEGRDPDNTPVLVIHPAQRGVGVTSIPARVYAY